MVSVQNYKTNKQLHNSYTLLHQQIVYGRHSIARKENVPNRIQYISGW